MSIEQPNPKPAETPAGYFVLMPSGGDQGQIDSREIGRRLWKGKFIILAGAIVFTLIAASHAYYLAIPTYRSEAVITVRVNGQNAGGNVGSQLGGLASLAGIDIGGRNPTRVEYVAILQSRRLAEQLITGENLLPILFAEKYDAANRRWKETEKAPTIEDGVNYFRDEICQINEDTKTSLITVRIDWRDRVLAAQWAKDLIDLANKDLRTAAVAEAQNNISYLTKQSEHVQVESLRQGIIRLMEGNLNQAMLANAQEDYALKIIDPPRVPDDGKFVFPARRLELIGGAIGGTLLAMVFVLWRKSGTQGGVRRSATTSN